MRDADQHVDLGVEERAMIPYEQILVATDFGSSSERAVAVAIDLAVLHGSALTLLHVWDVPSYAYGGLELAADDLMRPLRDRAQATLDRALDAIRKRVPDARSAIRCGDAWKEIDEAIRALMPDLVVMGARDGHRIARALFGSVTERIVRSSPVPVLTVHAGAAETPGRAAAATPIRARLRRIMFDKILVATDFGPTSDRAIRLAVDLAKQLHAALTLLHVWEPPPYAYGCRALISREELLRPGREEAERDLETTLAGIRKELPDVRGLVRSGDPAGEIGATIMEERPSIVFMGTHGRHGVDRVLTGSVAEQTVRTSPVPVLTVAAATVSSVNETGNSLAGRCRP